MVWKTGSSTASYTHPAQRTRQQPLNSCQKSNHLAASVSLHLQPLLNRVEQRWTLRYLLAEDRNAVLWGDVGSLCLCVEGKDWQFRQKQGHTNSRKHLDWSTCYSLCTHMKLSICLSDLILKQDRHLAYKWGQAGANTLIIEYTLYVPVCMCVLLHNLSPCFRGCWTMFYSTLVSCHSSCNLKKRDWRREGKK